MRSQPGRSGRFLSVSLSKVDLVRGDQRVLRRLDWSIEPGQRWLLQGANGAGKTQLLKLLAGDVWPQPGRLARRIYQWRGESCAEPYGIKQEIAYVGSERQDRYEHYEWNHRVATVVGTGLYRTDLPLHPLTAGDRLRVARLLGRLGIASLAARRFLTLSQGERRLVLLARALAWKPALLLLDEPLNGLDAANRARVLGALHALRRSALPWVYATHREDEIPPGATHRAVLEQGKVRITPLRRVDLRSSATAATRRGRARPATQVHGTARRAPQSARPAWFDLRNAWVWRDGVAVLRRLTLRIEAGDCWIVHGDNGSGKSTLLATLHGEHGVASQGSIERRGHVPGSPLARLQARIGVVSPELQAALPRAASAVDVVAAGRRGSLRLDGAASVDERRAALAALRGLGAGRLAAREIGTLSYGQARRVLFARALVRNPDILLLDEPYTGLDAPTRAWLRALIDDPSMNALTIVMASHHRQEWPQRATHELELRAGRVRYCGPLRAAVRGRLRVGAGAGP